MIKKQKEKLKRRKCIFNKMSGGCENCQCISFTKEETEILKEVAQEKKEEKLCQCGHPGGWHSDGEYTHTGPCIIQLNDEKKDVNKMEFCKCKKFKSKMKGGKRK